MIQFQLHQDLLLQLRNGSIRPIQVLRAMQRRALRAQEKLNCVTMVRIESPSVKTKNTIESNVPVFPWSTAMGFGLGAAWRKGKRALIRSPHEHKGMLFSQGIWQHSWLHNLQFIEFETIDQLWRLSTGMALLLNDPAKDHCLAVKQLLKMGAVPFCHTNVPQTMMSLETNNPAYGATGK